MGPDTYGLPRMQKRAVGGDSSMLGAHCAVCDPRNIQKHDFFSHGSGRCAPGIVFVGVHRYRERALWPGSFTWLPEALRSQRAARPRLQLLLWLLGGDFLPFLFCGDAPEHAHVVANGFFENEGRRDGRRVNESIVFRAETSET